MHPIQEKLLTLIGKGNIGNLTLRKICNLIDEDEIPQKIKHHLNQLEQKGFITMDTRNKKISRINSKAKNDLFLSVPIIGSANCGPATMYADENIEGYLKISKGLVSRQKGVFVIKAQGNSLNKANINGKNVEPGDFVLIDSSQTIPKDGDYVLSIIDNMANIKKFRLDKKNERIVLISESTQVFHPIFIHKDDDFRINGKVVDVIKKFEE